MLIQTDNVAHSYDKVFVTDVWCTIRKLEVVNSLAKTVVLLAFRVKERQKWNEPKCVRTVQFIAVALNTLLAKACFTAAHNVCITFIYLMAGAYFGESLRLSLLRWNSINESRKFNEKALVRVHISANSRTQTDRQTDGHTHTTTNRSTNLISPPIHFVPLAETIIRKSRPHFQIRDRP